jgi:enoyl-CoA hydratase/carnithine racemase
MSSSPSIPEFDGLALRVEGPVAHLELDRAASLNSLTIATLEEIARAARFLDDVDGLKVVVISGRGRAFCAGADLSSFKGEGGQRDREAGWRMAAALEELRAVTIARIHGWCVGGGLVLASACDLRVAADDARFSIPELDLGIPLAWGGIPRLVREIGPARTKELVMTCRTFDAAEAHDIGLLNRTVPAAELDAAVDELVASLVDKTAASLVATKRHTNAVTEAMVHTGRSWADADGLAAAFSDPEGAEVRARYLARLRERR